MTPKKITKEFTRPFDEKQFKVFKTQALHCAPWTFLNTRVLLKIAIFLLPSQQNQFYLLGEGADVHRLRQKMTA